jgi:DNA replication protein DnaC
MLTEHDTFGLIPFLDDADPAEVEENIRAGGERLAKEVPSRYVDAQPTHPDVQAWIMDLLANVSGRNRPTLRTGRSLLILGGTGTGKTFQAYGAVKYLAMSGAACRFRFLTAADLYAQLRPRPNVDSEQIFGAIAGVPLLAIDDLGAAKSTDWTEEINYRLVNHRYEHELPTLITSNVTPKELRTVLGERVASRLVEMAQRVVLVGDDRRRAEG